MTTVAVQHERRAAQRFEFNLPVHIRVLDQQHCGCLQDVSGRGVFLLVDSDLPVGSQVDLIFSMPAEVTLTQTMRVCCRGKILRVQRCPDTTKFGIAVGIESYVYLASGGEDLPHNAFDRIASLHNHHETSEPSQPASSRL